jgi:hypothetical protein
MEYEDSLLCPQETATVPHSQPAESNPHLLILISTVMLPSHLLLDLPNTLSSSKFQIKTCDTRSVSLFLQTFHISTVVAIAATYYWGHGFESQKQKHWLYCELGFLCLFSVTLLDRAGRQAMTSHFIIHNNQCYITYVDDRSLLNKE